MSDFIKIGPDSYVRKSAITSISIEKWREGDGTLTRRIKLCVGGQQITAHRMDVDELMKTLGIDVGG